MQNAAPLAPPTVPARSESSTLRLRHCPDCGYDLTSLPAIGRCPECGRAYDQETIVMHGWAEGKRATVGTSQDGWSWIIGLSFFVVLWSWESIRRQRWMGVGKLFLFLSVPFVLLLLRRWTTTRPGLIQVRLNAAGCVQDDDPDDLALLAGPLRLMSRWGWEVVGVSLIGFMSIMYLAGQMRRMSDWIVPAILLAFITPFVLWSNIRLERARGRVREAMVASEAGLALTPRPGQAFAPVPTPWSAVTDVKIKHDGTSETLEIAIEANSPGRTADRKPVEAILKCLPEEVAELRARVAAWRSA